MTGFPTEKVPKSSRLWRLVYYDKYHSEADKWMIERDRKLMKEKYEIHDYLGDSVEYLRQREPMVMNQRVLNEIKERKREVSIMHTMYLKQRREALRRLLEREDEAQTWALQQIGGCFKPEDVVRDCLPHVPGLPRLDSPFYAKYIKPYLPPKTHEELKLPPIRRTQQDQLDDVKRFLGENPNPHLRALITFQDLHVDQLKKNYTKWGQLTEANLEERHREVLRRLEHKSRMNDLKDYDVRSRRDYSMNPSEHWD